MCDAWVHMRPEADSAALSCLTVCPIWAPAMGGLQSRRGRWGGRAAQKTRGRGCWRPYATTPTTSPPSAQVGRSCSREAQPVRIYYNHYGTSGRFSRNSPGSASRTSMRCYGACQPCSTGRLALRSDHLPRYPTQRPTEHALCCRCTCLPPQTWRRWQTPLLPCCALWALNLRPQRSPLASPACTSALRLPRWARSLSPLSSVLPFVYQWPPAVLPATFCAQCNLVNRSKRLAALLLPHRRRQRSGKCWPRQRHGCRPTHRSCCETG